MPALDDRIRITVTQDELGAIAIGLAATVAGYDIGGMEPPPALVLLRDRMQARLVHHRRTHGR